MRASSDAKTLSSSAILTQKTRLLGTERIRITVYHPASNGLVERFNHQLKSALRAHEYDNWQENLRLVLLGIRTNLKADIQCSAAELMYGTTLRLPGKFFTPRSSNDFSKPDYAHRLSAFMRTPSPVSTRIQHRQVALPRELSTCSHVFILVDSICRTIHRFCRSKSYKVGVSVIKALSCVSITEVERHEEEGKPKLDRRLRSRRERKVSA
ncbi:unnamed protein product [Schistosoma curassoni]|uniref:Integrase catalytic domain-containing protein n=1 Tax=Schistosoma curassoni TaxID=6186 RepID=A0A183JED0_9TREM|nr:unnamed protein product [Schistosoma curassoni]